jgi:hypothetical protein
MRAALEGSDVRAIRRALGLPVTQFAADLGLHPDCLHRWESAGHAPVPIEGDAWTVLSALRQQILAQGPPSPRTVEAEQRVSNRLATGDVLLGFVALLAIAAASE